MSIGFVGAGRLAQALARGFISAGLVKPEMIRASCPPQDVKCLEEMEKLGCHTTFENRDVVRSSDVVVLSVKPNTMPKILREIAPVVTARNLITSVAMGVPIRSLEQDLPRTTRVIRVMPNTPCLVLQGASVFSRGSHAQQGDADVIKQLFSCVGYCEEAPESTLDAVTGLSGSGPAYVYVMIEALADGAVKLGLPRDLALNLAAHTFMGAGKMVADGGHPGALKDAVASPGGTTIHGLYHLESNGIRSLLMDTVAQATLKARELSSQADAASTSKEGEKSVSTSKVQQRSSA